MEGFSEEAKVTQDVSDLALKFKKYFEKQMNQEFGTFEPSTFQFKEEDSKIIYLVKLDLGGNMKGELMFSRDPNAPKEHEFSILKIGTEGGNNTIELD